MVNSICFCNTLHVSSFLLFISSSFFKFADIFLFCFMASLSSCNEVSQEVSGVEKRNLPSVLKTTIDALVLVVLSLSKCLPSAF